MRGVAGRAALASGVAGLLAAAAAAIVAAAVGDVLWITVAVLVMGAGGFAGAFLLVRPVELSVRETAEAARSLRGAASPREPCAQPARPPS